MLNPFPIQFLALLAYAILRLFVGGIFVYFGGSHIKRRHELSHTFQLPLFSHGLFAAWYLGVVELTAGAMFILGFYTQIAAIVAMILSLKIIILYNRFASPYIESRMFYTLLFAASFSLFITGAGAIAFDLPI